MSSAFECNVHAVWSIKKETFMNEKDWIESEDFKTTLPNVTYSLGVREYGEYFRIDIEIGNETIIKEMKLYIPSANFEGDLSLDSVISPEDGDEYSNIVYIKREDLLNPEKKFFVNDILKIEVRGILCQKETVFDLGDVLYRKNDKDFTIIVENAKIKIHKFLLGQFSSVIAKSLDKNQFKIENFDIIVVKTVVSLCYGQKSWRYHFVTNKEEKKHLFKIIEFTNVYDMPAIKEQVERELIKKFIGNETVCELANKSIEYKAEILRGYCVNFIVNCIKTGKPFDGFADLNKEIVFEVFKGTVCHTQSS